MLRTAKYNDSVRTKQIIDPTLRIVEMRQLYSSRINLIEETAEKTDTDLSVYILKGITEGLSYDSLRLRFNIPCSKDTYYDRYRRFFWILDKRRE